MLASVLIAAAKTQFETWCAEQSRPVDTTPGVDTEYASIETQRDFDCFYVGFKRCYQSNFGRGQS